MAGEGGEMGNPSFIKPAYGVCVCVMLIHQTFVMKKLSNYSVQRRSCWTNSPASVKNEDSLLYLY